MENGTVLKDWSKDRVIIDLSENEWLKLDDYITNAHRYIQDKRWNTAGKNLRMMFERKQELLAEFKDLPF